MDDIKEIYFGENYEPFLEYCELHQYKTMADLAKVPFAALSSLIGISPVLVSRIRMIFLAYLKKNPECLQAAAKHTKKAKAAAPIPDGLELKLQEYFCKNPDTLLRLADIAKAVGNAKRGDILKLLESAPWCKMVDANTFFYAPEKL